jgi:hypothetical protein
MNILIAGDSFATKSSTCNSSWMELLAEQHQVTNLAQAGVGEYKIYKQLRSIDVNKFGLVIVSHTSPSRIHTNNHPIHKSGFHKDCDLILTDLIEHFQPLNTSLQTAKNFFKYHYNEEYQIDIYNLLRRRINDIICVPYISLSHVEIVNSLAIENHNINLSTLWADERGNINHYTEIGNKFVFRRIQDELDRLR